MVISGQSYAGLEGKKLQVGKKEYPIYSQKRKYSRKLNFAAMTSAERDNPDLHWNEEKGSLTTGLPPSKFPTYERKNPEYFFFVLIKNNT